MSAKNFDKADENSSTVDSGFVSSEIYNSYTSSFSGDKSEAIPEEVVEQMEQPKEITCLDSGLIVSEEIIEDVQDFVPLYLNAKTKILIPNSEQFLLHQDEDGHSQLHIAVLHNLQKEIDTLLNMAPDPTYVNIKNTNGNTPLHIAVFLSMHTTIRKLLDAGADMNNRNYSGKNSLHIAVENGDFQTAQILLSAQSQDSEVLADLEIWNNVGETCFFMACKNRDIRMMRLMINKGADINTREGLSGLTPLHYAVQNKSMDVLEFLLSEFDKLNINAENYAGLTSFQLCVLDNSESLAKELVKRGAIPYYTREDSDDDDMDDSSNDEIDITQINNKISQIAVN